MIPRVDGWKILAEDEIHRAQAFVLVVTPDSLRSDSCRFEWTVATRLSRPIMRLELGPCDHLEVPATLRHTNRIQVQRHDPENSARALCHHLHQSIQVHGSTDASPER